MTDNHGVSDSDYSNFDSDKDGNVAVNQSLCGDVSTVKRPLSKTGRADDKSESDGYSEI